MYTVTTIVRPDREKNSIAYSQNYRIFGHRDPVQSVESIEGFNEKLNLNGVNSAQYVFRSFRYSTDRYSWSLWYDLDPNNLASVQAVVFDSTQPLYFEVKYLYDNGTQNVLEQPFVVTCFDFTFGTKAPQPVPNYSFQALTCSDELSPSQIVQRTSEFQPYNVGALVDFYQTMSFQTNQIFGHQAVYFRTLPESTGGDFIFKEWTVFNTVDRRCLKVLVPDNNFPDNKPMMSDFGVDFVTPFEIQIDVNYFQSIFGRGAQPRVRDFMYIPIANRMYEIKSCYPFRGIMNVPVYWKIQLNRYQNHSDTTKRSTDEKVLDLLLNSAERLFEPQVRTDTKDAVNPQQFKTISVFQDEVREAINRNLGIEELFWTYNYAEIIDYYYDMTQIVSLPYTYDLSASLTTNESQALASTVPVTLQANQESQIFSAWRFRYLNRYDLNVLSNQSLYIDIVGPTNTYDPNFGRQISILGYRGLNYSSANQANLLSVPASGTIPTRITFKGRDAAVVYKQQTSVPNNMTISCLFNVAAGAATFTLVQGYDNYTATGIKITASLSGTALTFRLLVNANTYTFAPITIATGTWYALVVPISQQFGQAALNVYSFGQDPANARNWNSISVLTQQSVQIASVPVELADSKWTLVSGPYFIANLRIFNTMLQVESHEYVISQQYLADESMLLVADNCKPQITAPFIAINR